MNGRALFLTLILLLMVALPVVPVAAQEPVSELSLVVEPEAAVGRDVEIRAYLLDSEGGPVQGEVVTFLLDMEFLNNFGEAEIGRATTDESGLALLPYVFKQDGEPTVTARFAGNRLLAAAEAYTAVPVAPGPATYLEETPFRMPGANINIVVAVLATTWGLLILVMGLMWLISRASVAEGPKLWRTSHE